VVVNVPDYAANTVAEGAFSLMIALCKRLKPITAKMERHMWTWPVQENIGFDLAYKTVGVIGLGKIGSSFARMANGFLMNVIAYDPGVSEKEMQKNGITKVCDLKTLAEQSDIISIHCVLNSDTHHLVSKEIIARMKPSAILINSARGAVVDEVALVDAVKEQRIWGVGLDVFSEEPITEEHIMYPLLHMDNVILTPHLAFYTREAMQRLEQDVLDRCSEFIMNRPTSVHSKDPRLQGQRNCIYVA